MTPKKTSAKSVAKPIVKPAAKKISSAKAEIVSSHSTKKVKAALDGLEASPKKSASQATKPQKKVPAVNASKKKNTTPLSAITTASTRQKPTAKSLPQSKAKATPQPVAPKKQDNVKSAAGMLSSENASASKERTFVTMQAPMQFWQDILGLIQGALGNESAQKMFQQSLAQSLQDIPKQGFTIPDPRLQASVWQNDPFYAHMTQLYAYQSAVMERMFNALPLADESARRKLQFMSRQVIDAASPANFAWSNPDFINRALATKGESVMAGLKHLLDDMQKGRITHVDESQFAVGRNVAVTPGKVVLRTPLFELLEYAPTTPTVSKRPMLFVPPCINKYYIMDLSPNNSLVRFTVEQGHHLYLISWCNIDAETQLVAWDHYIGSVIAAINFVRDDNAGENCNVLGFCVGGTILSTTLAVMAAKEMVLPASVTLLTTLLDFSEPGDLGVFLSERLLQELESQVPQGGVVPGSQLAQVFSILRPRDLVWNYVTQKYLKGEKPKDFDILYWNGDSTNLAVRMIAWYLRHCYWENGLISGKAQVLGERIDLSRINIPAFVYASREDHIVPWQSAYNSAKHLGDSTALTRFVLGASGHIAGVINPANTNKRNYWIGANQSAPSDESAEQWMETSQEVAGSWWNDWKAWLALHQGGEQSANAIGYDKKKSLGEAPGNYVRVRDESTPIEQVADPQKNPLMTMVEKWMEIFTPRNK